MSHTLQPKDVEVVLHMLSGIDECATEAERAFADLLPGFNVTWRSFRALAEGARAVIACCEDGITPAEYARRQAVATMAEDALTAMGEAPDEAAHAATG